MATEEPWFDLFSPYFTELVADYDREAFPEGPPEDFEAQVGAAYNDFFKRPYVCTLMADVMTGRWKLGKSQEMIAARLGGSDRTWVSHSLHKGRLSLDLYVRLRCCPTRPSDWEPSIDALRMDMGRGAFIGVAQLLASFIPNRPLLMPETFDELNYELICELVSHWETWLPLRVAGREMDLALQLVRNVCEDQNRNVGPRWYTAAKQREVEARTRRLKGDRAIASAYLTQLEQNWMTVIAKTFHSLAQVKWRQP
jgi:hypothetical protein